MDMIPLSAAVRDPKISPKTVRKAGSVPCVVYGSGTENLSLQCPLNELHKAFVKAGESTLVELNVQGGKKIPVLFKDIQFHAVSGNEVHADFYAVNMKEEIETTVPLKFEGESLAVKDLQATFVSAHHEVTVRCLPSDLPHELPVDISGMVQFGDVIVLKDIKVPKGVTIMDDPETVVASVQEPRKEEVIEPIVAPEGAVPAEGAAAEGAPAADAAGAAAAGDKKEDKK